MKKELYQLFSRPVYPPGDDSTLGLAQRHHAPKIATCINTILDSRVLFTKGAAALAITLLCCSSLEARDGNDWARDVRQFIDQQVGGINKLKVPATDAEIPVPPPMPGSGNTPYRYETTEAKRYLGKLLFHDPVRTARININTGQPVDLPAGTDFGGQLTNAQDIQGIVNGQKQTGSCDSCHLGETATKAGQRLNFNVGGEGRGYRDENGNFVARRRPQAILPQLRTKPLFDGDVLADFLPTLTDIDLDSTGTRVVTTPALFYHTPAPQALLATGRLDDLDSVGRNSLSVIGFAFNNRLLFGGFAGEPQSTPGSLNPLQDPAGENLTLLLLDAHRMLNFQSAEILKIPAFVKLFRDAFPQEAAQADAANDMTILVNDQTVFRATSTFLRTTVTRNTPYDKFLAGNNRALTPGQLRGAKLFFTPAAGGAGGANCFVCHNGPMLNKQYNDPDVSGIGTFVAENFVNVGIGDHPVQALNALARGHLDPAKLGADGFPYHAEDNGRQEVTHDPTNANAFQFRVLTLRQLKEAGNFFHSASFTNIRDVVEYFNAGVPQDPTAGAAATLDVRFTHPRGKGFPRGLGLTEDQVADIADFIENGLYDPAFSHYDPNSTTPFFELTPKDVTYSKYHPELAALGAKDGFVLSGLAMNNNDALSRRDQGLEFLDVTNKLGVQVSRDTRGSHEVDTYTITNTSTATDVSGIVDTNLLIIVQGLTQNAQLENASGITNTGDPYLRVFLPNGQLNPGQSIVRQLTFDRSKCGSKKVSYTLDFMSGQGKP